MLGGVSERAHMLYYTPDTRYRGRLFTDPQLARSLLPLDRNCQFPGTGMLRGRWAVIVCSSWYRNRMVHFNGRVGVQHPIPVC